MRSGFKDEADRVLQDAVAGNTVPGVPGVIAMATDRNANVYEGAAGERNLAQSVPMTFDTVVSLFSCTKAITGVTVMQLVQEGQLSLDDPAENFVPDIADIQVLEGFQSDGEPILRAPKSAITIGQLLLHTAGFGYDTFNSNVLQYIKRRHLPRVGSGSLAALQTVLLFDPGARWEYGTNIDWAGRVVEAVTAKRLGDVMRERVFTPLAMSESAFTLTPAMRTRRAGIHQRGIDGTVSPLPGYEWPQNPEVQMGGHALYSTAGDYMKFIRMFLNDGAAPHERVLDPQTVAFMARNGLGRGKIKPLPGVIASVSNDVDIFPGISKSWGYSFMINDERAPTGRPAGGLSWAGLANLYFWIDRANGIGGFWATQILPFIDPVSFPAYLRFETAVYDYLN